MNEEKYLDPNLDQDLHTLAMDEINESDVSFISHEEVKSLLSTSHISKLSEFEDVKTIGLGGIGTVMSGFDPNLKREVAIKILRQPNRHNKNHIERFIKEARATAQIDHPNVVPVHSFGVFDDAGIYFTMKKVAGEDLRSIIKELAQGNLDYTEKYPLNRLMEILIGICQAIAYAHHRGAVHRDLKPANIMVGHFGEVQVMDWGMVKYLNGDQFKDSVFLDGKVNEPSLAPNEVVVSGTPAFMSPEQASGRTNEIDARSDIYSLGCIMYAMLTLEDSPIEKSSNTHETLNRVIHGMLLPPRRRAPKRNISKELNAICMKAMAGDPRQRYQAVSEMIKDIHNWQGNEPVSAYSDPPHTRVIKLFRRRPLIPSVLIVALLTIFIYWAFGHVDSIVKNNYYISIADYNLNQADLARLRARSTYIHMQRFQKGEDINRSAEHLQHDFERQVLEFNNYSSNALDFFQRSEGLNIKDREVVSRIDELLLKRLRFYIAINNVNDAMKLMETIKMPQRRSFYQALEKDEILNAQVKMILERSGTLSVNINRPDAVLEYAELPQHGGVSVRYGEFKVLPSGPFTQYQMEKGVYLMKITIPALVPIFLPFTIDICGHKEVSLKIPQEIPPEMLFVPGGEIALKNDFKNNNNNLRAWQHIPDFFISRHPVSFKEYRQFWLSLDDQKLKRRYMPKMLKNREYRDIFDETGTLCEDIDINTAVFGVGPSAANAYCRWLGERRQQSLALPSSVQWRRAVAGVPSYEWRSGTLYPASEDERYETAESIFGLISTPLMREITMSGKVPSIVNNESFAATGTVILDEDFFNNITFRTAMETE